MQRDNRVFDDFARVAGAAASNFVALREEIEARLRDRLERFLGDMDLVGREEFEVVRSMAQKAREENEVLAERVARLEKGESPKAAKPRARATKARAKPARRKTPKRTKG